MKTPLPLILRQMWQLVFACFVFGGLAPAAQAAFVHPGGLHTLADLDRMKAKVAAGESPWIDGWNRLVADTSTLLNYNPSPSANMGNSRQNCSRDAHAAYNAIIRWYVSGDTAYAEKAVQICNAWSAVVNQVPTGTDIPGLSGIPIFEFALVGELLRIYPGWAPADFERFKTMMTTWWYPVCHNFLTNHNPPACTTHWWANWDACNVGALIAIGVLCDNQAIYDEGVNYFQTGQGAGSMLNAVSFIHPNGLGQWQESGRDQEHAQLGVGLLATACEVAWKQGLDLYGFMNNRLLAGAEYVARTNLSRPVPFAFYNNCDDVNHYFVSTNGLGRLDDRPLWEMVYNHYVIRKGLSAPNVRKIAELMRPEHGSADHFGYGTLTFTLDAAASPYPAAPTPPTPTGLAATAGVGRVTLRWEPSAGDTAQGYRIQRSTTSGGPYATIASWADNTFPGRTDTGVVNGTTYYYVVAANNASGTSANSPEVSATPLAAGALPEGWARQDVGAVNSAGGASYADVSNDTFIVSGNGTGIGGAADSLSFAYRAATGDCTITGRLLVNGSIKVGLMIRGSLNANASTVALTLGDAGGRETRFGTRASTGGAMSFQLGNAYTWTPAWYRLQRTGDTFTASQSSDGVTWFEIGSSSADMGDVAYVGLAVSAGTATFDNVSVDGTFLAGPPASLSAVNAPNQVTLNWAAAPGATSYNIKRSSTADGPYAVLASGLTTTSFVDSGLTNGAEFYYVVSSVQGSHESANSNEVLGLPGDVSFNWSATPTSGNWSVASNWTDGIAPSDGASLAFGASSTTSLTNDIADLAVNRITFNSGATAFTLAGNAIDLSGNVLNSSGATQTLGVDLTLHGTRTISANTGQITITGAIGDGGAGYGIVKTGSQPLSLTGQSTFSGDVTHNTGTLSIAGIGTGTAGAPITGALGRGTLRLGGGLLTSSAPARVFNNIILQPGTTTNLASTVANLTLAGNISGSGNINETGTNTGGTHFNGDNSGFTGTFTSSNAGGHRVRFNSPQAGSAAARWVLNNSQADGNGLNYGAGTISFGALSGGGVFRNNAIATSTISIGALNTDTTFTGVMIANGARIIAVTKVGTGSLTFTGAHTYDGPTTVESGTLLINGSLRSAVTVNGGTFGGSGSNSAAITVKGGAALAPGNPSIAQGVGVFRTTGALLLDAGAVYRLQLNGETSTSDCVVAANVSLGGAVLDPVEMVPNVPAPGTNFTIVDNIGANPVTGAFAGLPEGATFSVGANLYRISYTGGTGNDVVLTASVAATAELGNLVQIYDGAAKPVAVTTAPAGLAVDITYDGAGEVPVEAGSYAVTATIVDPVYVGSVEGVLVIEKAAAPVVLHDLNQTYDGAPRTVSATTTPAGLPVSIRYDGEAIPPTGAGSYSVVATVEDRNYAGRADGTLLVAKAAAAVTLGDLVQSYDGAPKQVSAITDPAGLPVNFDYEGGNPPTYPGEYDVTGTIDHANYAGAASDTMTITVTALVRHAPTLNGLVDGSVQVLAAENLTLNQAAALSGDLLVRGKPQVNLNGNPTIAGVLTGPGAATPATHVITINGGAVLRYLVRQVDPTDLPSVVAPAAPAGNRSVVLNQPGQTPGAWSTLRDLTLNGGAGAIAVPAGAYGSFTANGGSSFVLGVPGATEPARYDLQNLTLNGGSALQVVGPVIVALRNGTAINGQLGNSEYPEWLTFQIWSGGLTLNSGAVLHGHAVAPSGTIVVNSNATVRGSIAADRLTINSGGLVDEATP
jgi:autotransporter-associated beta strand protein